MQKYFISAACLFLWANMAFSQTTQVEVTATSTNDTPTQAATREQLKSEVAQKQTDGWEVMNTDATIYVPPATNDLQRSINREGATVISQEEFDKKFKSEK